MASTEYEQNLWDQGYARIMGLDEVGRGCLAGPVVAAGVILDPNDIPSDLHDSKMLSERDRIRIEADIKQCALFWTVQESSVEQIQQMNILWASIAAMVACSEAPGAAPDYLLIDGNRFTSSIVPHQCIIKGDALSASIAAASILAKQYRDTLMRELHEAHPHYGWDRNVGYPTKEHRRGLQMHGPTSLHRASFKWKPV